MGGFIHVHVVAGEGAPEDQMAVLVVLDEPDPVAPAVPRAGAFACISVCLGCRVHAVEGDQRNVHGQSLASRWVTRRHQKCVIRTDTVITQIA